MYETRTFYLAESIKVKDLLSLLSNVADRFLIESTNQKEMIESLRKSIERTKQHAFALYHSVNDRTSDGCYYEFGLMNVEKMGIIAALEFMPSMEHRGPSIISQDLKIDGIVLYSTVPSWKSIFSDEEQKKVFDELELLITSELTKLSVNIRKVESKSVGRYRNGIKNTGGIQSSIFSIKNLIFLIFLTYTNILILSIFYQ